MKANNSPYSPTTCERGVPRWPLPDTCRGAGALLAYYVPMNQNLVLNNYKTTVPTVENMADIILNLVFFMVIARS